MLSFVVSALGAFVALGAARHIRTAEGGWSYFNLASAAIALGGVGIWCMHFIGMVAFRIPVRQSYGVMETTISFVAAVVVAGIAFWYLAAKPFTLQRLFVAGPIAGLAVAVMHYLGMSGIRFPGYIEWDFPLVVASVVIAVVAATAAFWLAFHTRQVTHRVLASGTMAAAVCSMHYTGMAAASFYCRTDTGSVWTAGTLSLPMLGEIVFVVALLVSAGLLADQLMVAQLQRQAAKDAQSTRMT